MGDILRLDKVRLTVTEPDGRDVQYGPNLVVLIADGHASAAHRRKVRREGEVAAVEYLNVKLNYRITMVDGSVWQTRGCGCGG